MAHVYAEELACFELDDGKVVGMLLTVMTAIIVFARDARLRYRSTAQTDFYPTAEEAQTALSAALDVAAAAAAEEHH